MAKNEYHPVSSYYADMLAKVREQILDSIRGLIERLGGEVSVQYYTNDEPDLNRYTFFDLDNDGRGLELFVTHIKLVDDDVEITLEDSESCCEVEWDLSDLNASNANYLLMQLEEIAEYVYRTGEEIVTDYQ